ncbi:POU domain, class 6, transcription factor 2 [Eumeta japonica]|uniref:POU domain, class 6, transcription factor 2 n=1 Tax=Eumeta variegata TaxID=151549 RepID=A0A4C1Z0D7_EUMVA|nr:POU domain, class 6, transcription factor 2 [Eumeta japonica]
MSSKYRIDQPTISQSSSNVVDGINLEDIKEFAKAFKLRRLGLGLTQTQVGQALSVTEGPAYSQSAICSMTLSLLTIRLINYHSAGFRSPSGVRWRRGPLPFFALLRHETADGRT